MQRNTRYFSNYNPILSLFLHPGDRHHHRQPRRPDRHPSRLHAGEQNRIRQPPHHGPLTSLPPPPLLPPSSSFSLKIMWPTGLPPSHVTWLSCFYPDGEMSRPLPEGCTWSAAPAACHSRVLVAWICCPPQAVLSIMQTFITTNETTEEKYCVFFIFEFFFSSSDCDCSLASKSNLPNIGFEYVGGAVVLGILLKWREQIRELTQSHGVFT